ncbi:hypothetical protein OA871_00175 [Paracoccaceae bacterium]|nr:hypothetical protein [Paracoccaceae bacterium]
MKLASYQKHKKDYDTKIFGETKLLSSSDSDDLVTKFPCETIFTIVGLGGTSGDLLLNISDILRWGESKDLVNFCIMPFNFEGAKRKKYADEQFRLIYRLPKDGLCFVLANQDLLKDANSQTTFDKAFTKFHEQIESIILKHKVKSGKSVIHLNNNDVLGN